MYTHVALCFSPSPLFQLFSTLHCLQRNEGFARFLSADLYICREKRKKKEKKERRGDKKRWKTLEKTGTDALIKIPPSIGDVGRMNYRHNSCFAPEFFNRSRDTSHDARLPRQYPARTDIRGYSILYHHPPPPRIYGASRCRA